MSSSDSFFAHRLSKVKPSPTLAMTRAALELKAAGKKVIALAAGEPDFDTPQHIKDAATEAMRKGDLSRKTNATELAGFFMSSQQGATLLCKPYRSAEPMRRFKRVFFASVLVKKA